MKKFSVQHLCSDLWLNKHVLFEHIKHNFCMRVNRAMFIHEWDADQQSNDCVFQWARKFNDQW